MLGLRFAYLLALVVWLGGLLVLASVAPIAFDVLDARVPDGHVVAGVLFGALLARFHLVSYACGALMIATLVLKALVGPRPRPFAPRVALIGVMLGLTVAVAVPIAQRIEGVQVAVNGPIGALPSEDPRKAEFDSLHGLSTWLLGANVLGGLVLVLWEAREQRR